MKKYCSSGAVHREDLSACESGAITHYDYLWKYIKLCDGCRAPPVGKDTWLSTETKEGCTSDSHCRWGGVCVAGDYGWNVRVHRPNDFVDAADPWRTRSRVPPRTTFPFVAGVHQPCIWRRYRAVSQGARRVQGGQPAVDHPSRCGQRVASDRARVVRIVLDRRAALAATRRKGASFLPSRLLRGWQTRLDCYCTGSMFVQYTEGRGASVVQARRRRL